MLDDANNEGAAGLFVVVVELANGEAMGGFEAVWGKRLVAEDEFDGGWTFIDGI